MEAQHGQANSMHDTETRPKTHILQGDLDC